METLHAAVTVAAVCLVVLTVAGASVAAAAVVRLRYERVSGAAMFDTWSRAFCDPSDCVRLSRTVIPYREALRRNADYPPGSAPALP